MPKQKTDDLIRLIKSLSRSEKRHFRLFVKRNQNSDDILFLQLFDFLDKYNEYDEGLILKKLPGIKKRQLSNLKAHLYKQLLMSLRLLNKNYNLDIELRESIDYAKVLYNKGLYRQALDILDKTKTKALKYNEHSITLDVVEFEKLIEGQYITRSIENRAEELTIEANQQLKTMSRIHDFSNLALQLYSLYLKVGHARNEKDHYFVQEFFTSRLPKHFEYNELDFYSKVYLNQAHVWYHHIKQDFLFCYKYAQHWVDLFRDNPVMLQYQAPLYLKGCHNLLSSLFYVRHYEKFRDELHQLEDVPNQIDLSQIHNIEGLYYLYRYIHRINLHYIEGTFTESLEFIPHLVELIDKNPYNWDDHRIMVFNYRIACLYFGSADPDTAITYLNKITNTKNPDFREDIQSFARILSLICHFELDNIQLIEYQVKSVYRFLSKMDDLHAVQREIIRFLRKLPRMHESELKSAFIVLREKLQKVEQDEYESRPFLYLDIISWLDSKINNCPIQEVIRAKFLAQRKG